MKVIKRFNLKNWLVFVLLIQLSFVHIFAAAEWTVLVYVQAKNNLSKFAAKNLGDMASVGSNGYLNILVQWYQPTQKGVWRYKIEKNKINLEEYVPTETDGNHSNDLVDSMRWAVKNHPANNYGLILWNHGIGILDPSWGSLHGVGINSLSYGCNPKIQIQDLTCSDSSSSLADDSVSNTNNFVSNSEIINNFFIEQEFLTSRGILFNEYSKTYMTNQELVAALSKIKTEVLKNKKIGILGMDACLMAMLEMAYQVRGYAEYLVASQEVELAQGWDYLAVMQGLSVGKISPQQFAKNIVNAYERYYKNKIKFYTQSAVVLDQVVLLKDSLNSVIYNINFCKQHDASGITNLVKEARKNSLQFSIKNYVDLYSFYSKLHESLGIKYNLKNVGKSVNKQNGTTKITQTYSSTIQNTAAKLQESLGLGMKLIEGSVIANTSGSSVTSAKGLSIYFPLGKPDSSYYFTEFAKECLWIDFLHTYFNN